MGVSFSARPDSNSAMLLDAVIARLPEDLDVSTAIFSLADVKIECVGYEQCYTTTGVHGDTIDEIITDLLAAECILFSIPTTYGMPPAGGKALLDRMDPLWKQQALAGKSGAVIVNGATDPAQHLSIQLCASNMHNFFAAHGVPLLADDLLFGNSEHFEAGGFSKPHIKSAQNRIDEFAQAILQVF